MNSNNEIDPTILVIFGISGSLATKKLIPSLFELYKRQLLPEKFVIIGLSRQDINLDEYMTGLNLPTKDNIEAEYLNKFKTCFNFINFEPSNLEDFHSLSAFINQTNQTFQSKNANLLLYLSIPPNIFSTVVKNLGLSGLNKPQNGLDSKLLVEKPFGYDVISAKKLIEDTRMYFEEDRIYRIDHYLAKDTAQNILTFRRFNPLFQTAWNNQHIKSIKILALENIGIEGRAKFYESIGALKDLIQSHLLQLMALTTMTLPKDLSNKDAIHLARHDVLSNIKSFKDNDDISKNVTRGQYSTYREEVGNPNSMVETYASITIEIENSIWKGVPITLATGKGMKEKRTEIVIDFSASHEEAVNQLTFRIQPNEGIDICLTVKKPGLDRTTEVVTMDFSYKQSFDNYNVQESYEKVIIDALREDNTLFATSDEVIDTWNILQPIMDYWAQNQNDLIIYANGSEDI